MHHIRLASPLRSFVQERDVLEFVDGESIAGLTSSQAASLISARASDNPHAKVSSS